MNLPVSVADPSLLQHEHLLNFIIMHEQCSTSRSGSDMVVSNFVRAAQEDDQVALAIGKWAHLVFTDDASNPTDENSVEIIDQGQKLYKAFFHYQLELFRGNVSKAHEYQCKIVRNGMAALNLRDLRPTQGKGSGTRKKVRGDQSSTSATKKRKPSSQKPPVIAPSDDSEEDKGPGEPEPSRETSIPSTISHRPKRIASVKPPRDFPGVKTQAIRKRLARGPNKVHRGEARSSHCPSFRASFRSGKFVSRFNQGGRSAASLHSRRQRHGGRVLSASNQLIRTRLHFRKLQKKKTLCDLPTRPSKRLRLASMSTLHNGIGEESDSKLNVWPGFVHEPVTRTRLIFGPPLIRGNPYMKAKGRKKRSRPEFEAGSVESRESVSADSCEPLGRNIRPLRALPRKVRKERLVPVADSVTAVFGVLDGTPSQIPSLEYADQLLRDVASNGLAALQEEVDSHLPDWTQDQDEECDDLDEHDQDEMDDDQFISVTSAPLITTPKPPTPASPRIWAMSRQEVCESFEYFRSYHSGVYSKDDIVKGYLLGAYAASRDIFHHGGKLIISHGGGKSESILDPRRGPKRFQTDQDQEASDKSVRALLRTCKERRPLVLLADDRYALFPYDLSGGNYTYVVLGLYWISHAWAECQDARDGSGRIVRWKFAFQWCEGQDNPWWMPHQETKDEASELPISDSGMNLTQGLSRSTNTDGNSNVLCETCQERSPFVYKEGWMCLNPRCGVFWTLNGEEPKQLDYREEFLSPLPQKFERLPNITPTRVVETSSGITTTFAFSKGWHCIKCGRLSCRFKWEHWECSNCEFKHIVKGRIRLPKEFWNQRPHREFLHSRIAKDSGILACRLEPIDLGAHRGFTNRLTFILPYNRGKIHLILGTPLSNEEADNIFQLYQRQGSAGELKLRRYPLRNHRARGLLLTNYFSQNSGEPYQYVGGTGNTVPFHEAPDCVRRALAVIKERSSLALGTDIPFNEILSAAYMERQKMSFHSDSEKGLGPVVASLSLGSAALMHFRPHVNVDNPKGRSAYALTLILRHGDVLIMEGEGVQKCYEHTVIPMNFRIAATARCIGSA